MVPEVEDAEKHMVSCDLLFKKVNAKSWRQGAVLDRLIVRKEITEQWDQILR